MSKVWYYKILLAELFHTYILERIVSLISLISRKITPGDRLPRTTNLYTWLVSEGRDQGMALLTRVGGTQAMESALMSNPNDSKLKTKDWKKHMHQGTCIVE